MYYNGGAGGRQCWFLAYLDAITPGSVGKPVSVLYDLRGRLAELAELDWHAKNDGFDNAFQYHVGGTGKCVCA